MAIINAVRPKACVANIVAHDLAISIKEHEKYFGVGTYPYKHNTDPLLHEALLAHAAHVNVVFTPSDASRGWILHNTPAERVEVIPHGTDLPPEIPPLPAAPVFGYLGAAGPDKGLVYLLIAWRYNKPSSQLIFGGHCYDFVRVCLGNIVHGIQARSIKNTGWVPDVKDFYSQISVYIQPSVTEGFGIEVLEAMSYGRPVIVSAGAGAADIVTSGREGFIVPPGDPQAIREAMDYFHEHPDKIQEMGANAAEKAREYTWDKIEKRYETIYKEIIDANNSTVRPG